VRVRTAAGGIQPHESREAVTLEDAGGDVPVLDPYRRAAQQGSTGRAVRTEHAPARLVQGQPQPQPVEELRRAGDDIRGVLGGPVA
jgi:hypothetical protein